MERKLINRAPNDAMKTKGDNTTVWKYSKPEDPSSWFIFENQVYMHCEGVYGFSGLGNHSIDKNGEVNVSVLSRDGIGGYYHEYVKLLDWDQNYYKEAGELYIKKHE